MNAPARRLQPGNSTVEMHNDRATGALIAPEYAFAIIGLIFGLLFVYASPPWGANDEDRHFFNSYFYSTGQNGMRQNGKRVGGDLPESVVKTASAYQGLVFSPTVKLSRNRIEQSARVPLDEARTVFYDNPSFGVNPFAFSPYIAGIWISRFIDSNPVHLLWGARIAGLLTYLALVFVAIRTIPIHKWVLVAVALTPMTLYQASSVTYDMLCISLAYLLLALIVRFAVRDQPVSTGELALFFFVAVLQRYAKDAYFLFPFLFFLIPRQNIGSNIRVAAIFLLLCALVALPRFTWDIYIRSLDLEGGTSLQSDFVFDGGKQVAFYLQRPLEFIAYLWLNVVSQSRVWISGAVGRFGYAYATLPGAVVFMHGLALLALSVLDSSTVNTFSRWQKTLIATIGAGSVALIIVGFFVVGTPVGGHELFGVQGRYFLPILPVLLLLDYIGRFKYGVPERWKSIGVPLYCVCLLGFALTFINDYFYF
jgi:uncharacterized membrane protein